MRLLATIVLGVASVGIIRAQSHYQLASNSPSGGTATGVSSIPGNSFSHAYGYANGSYSGVGGGNISAQCSGQTTFTWNWNSQTEAPPENVIVAVTASAGWQSMQGGSCDDGYGDPVIPMLIPPPANVVFGGNTSGTHYVVYNNPGYSFSLQLTPTTSSGSGSCNVSVSMSPTDVVLTVGGGINPWGMNPALGATDSCLIGQHTCAVLNAGGYFNQSNGVCNWNISTTGYDSLMNPSFWGGPAPAPTVISYPQIHHWKPLANSFPTTAMSSTGSAPYFYGAGDWFAPSAGTEIITASASVYAPNGTRLGTVQGTYTIQADPPNNVSMTEGLPGTAVSYATLLTSGYDKNTAPGMTLNYKVVTPPAYRSGGTGYVEMAQLTDYYETTNITIATSNGWALDNSFQYNESNVALGATTTDTDTPTLPHIPAGAAQVTDYYQAYEVYYPPDNGYGSEFVPISSVYWQWVTSDAWPWGHQVASPVTTGSATDPVPMFFWDKIYSNQVGGG